MSEPYFNNEGDGLHPGWNRKWNSAKPTPAPEAASSLLALSIRQPWAWLVIHGGKDIENRTWPTKIRGRVLIHASKGLTVPEWEDAHEFVAVFNDELAQSMPRVSRLERGGIIGEAEIVDCVQDFESEWFSGPYGFVIRNPKPLPFRPCRGALGFFRPVFSDL